jgi:hypothetical protein
VGDLLAEQRRVATLQPVGADQQDRLAHEATPPPGPGELARRLADAGAAVPVDHRRGRPLQGGVGIPAAERLCDPGQPGTEADASTGAPAADSPSANWSSAPLRAARPPVPDDQVALGPQRPPHAAAEVEPAAGVRRTGPPHGPHRQARTEPAQQLAEPRLLVPGHDRERLVPQQLERRGALPHPRGLGALVLAGVGVVPARAEEVLREGPVRGLQVGPAGEKARPPGPVQVLEVGATLAAAVTAVTLAAAVTAVQHADRPLVADELVGADEHAPASEQPPEPDQVVDGLVRVPARAPGVAAVGGGAQLEQLARVVPLVERLARLDALAALEPHQRTPEGGDGRRRVGEVSHCHASLKPFTEWTALSYSGTRMASVGWRRKCPHGPW